VAAVVVLQVLELSHTALTADQELLLLVTQAPHKKHMVEL
jgi:hypothetical protein